MQTTADAAAHLCQYLHENRPFSLEQRYYRLAERVRIVRRQVEEGQAGAAAQLEALRVQWNGLKAELIAAGVRVR